MDKKNKVYKRKIYFFETTYACGAVAVDQDGYVYPLDTAPIFRWMGGKKFSTIMKQLRTKNKLVNCIKIDVDIDPF